MYTPYNDVNKIIEQFKNDIIQSLGDNLVGIYLFGSLSYGDFDQGRSDIDLSVITNTLLTQSQYQAIEELHKQIENNNRTWAGRLECSYTPLTMFNSPIPPGDRPYWGESELYTATYGNEWIINNYLIQEYGVTIYGKPFKDITPHISITQVRMACKQDLIKEWQSKLNDDLWLSDPHYQSYLVLNLCRIIHTILNSKASSKNVSAVWVKTNFPEWGSLIDDALSWKYGETMDSAAQTKKFLSFALDRSK